MDIESGHISSSKKDFTNLTPDEIEDLVTKAKENGEHIKAKPFDKCDRLTSHFAMVHETCGQQPIRSGGAFSVMLKSKEQPFERRLDVTESKMEVGKGCWITDPGYLIISNKATLPFNASPEQQEEFNNKVIIISIEETEVFDVPPGGYFIARCHKGIPRLEMQCQSGECPVNLVVMPR